MNDPGFSLTLKVAGSDVPVLSEDDRFQLSCGTGGCASNCCKASAPVILNPYEIALICRAVSMSYEDFLDIVDTDRANGLPLIMLPRDPVCHFHSDNGCRIYHARPLACRLFPLGRVYDGYQSRLVLPQRNICTGLSTEPARSVADYLRSQDTTVLLAMADRWIEFVNEVEAWPLPDKPITSIAFHMLVYSPDTPPVPSTENADSITSIDERYLLRLETAIDQLPRFLKIT